MTKSNFEKVIEFHESFGLPYSQTLNIENLQNFKIVSLRIKLIVEEFNELCHSKDLIEQLDAIGDLLYVVYGAGVSFGINLDQAFNQFCIQMMASKQIASSTWNPKDTNFQKTIFINKLLNKSPTEKLPSYIEQDPSIDFHRQIYDLSYALLMCNYTKVESLLVTMLFSLYGTGYYCDFNVDQLFTEIHRSNMSKLCQSEVEAIDSVAWYQQNQSDRYPCPTYCQTKDQKHWVVFEKTTDKRLKSIYFSPPKICIN